MKIKERKKRSRQAFVASLSQEDVNTRIDEVYAEIAELVALRSEQPNPLLEQAIEALYTQLRQLQQQEGDRIRAALREKLDGPIAAGLEILKHQDEIRARFGLIPKGEL